MRVDPLGMAALRRLNAAGRAVGAYRTASASARSPHERVTALLGMLRGYVECLENDRRVLRHIVADDETQDEIEAFFRIKAEFMANNAHDIECAALALADAQREAGRAATA